MDCVLVKLLFITMPTKCTFPCCCEETRKTQSSGGLDLWHSIVKFFLYNVPYRSFGLNFLICQFCSTVSNFIFKKKRKANAECCTWPMHENEGDGWASCGPTCRFLGFCEASQKPQNLLFIVCHLVCSHDLIGRLVVSSLKAQEVTGIILECHRTNSYTEI